MNARESARLAVFADCPGTGAADLRLATELADAASEVWEPIARTFRAHLPYQGLVSTRCRACDQRWPCPEWRRADEEMGP